MTIIEEDSEDDESDESRAITFSHNSRSKVLEDAIKNPGKFRYFRHNEERKSGGPLWLEYNVRLIGQTENTLVFANEKCFRKSQFAIKLNPRYNPRTSRATPKPVTSKSESASEKKKNKMPQADEQFQQIANETNFDSVSFEPHNFNFDSFVKRNLTKQTFPDPAIFKTATQIAADKKKKSNKQPLMSEEEYPAQSFTFVQPQEHTNIPQGSIHPLPQVTLPSFSETFGPEAPVDNAGMADENLAGQQPTIS